MSNETKTTTKTLIGWTRNGQLIETPEGIHAGDYFDTDENYLGPDEDGVEPVFATA